MKNDPHVAAAELDRLTSSGKIHWYGEDGASPDLRARPRQLIAKVDKVRAVHDLPNHRYCLNAALVKPPVRYSDVDGFLRLSSSGVFVGGLDFRDCSLRWLAVPSCRRFLAVRRPVSVLLGMYLFLPFDSGPYPGWNDRCVKEI